MAEIPRSTLPATRLGVPKGSFASNGTGAGLREIGAAMAVHQRPAMSHRRPCGPDVAARTEPETPGRSDTGDALEESMKRHAAELRKDVLAEVAETEAAERMAAQVFIEDAQGNIVAARAGDVLEDLEQDDVLLREFRECIA